MIRDITIGQYYATDSVIHRLDPRVKVVGTLAYLISLFCFNKFSGYIIAALFFAILVKISHVPFKFMVKGLKPFNTSDILIVDSCYNISDFNAAFFCGTAL